MRWDCDRECIIMSLSQWLDCANNDHPLVTNHIIKVLTMKAQLADNDWLFGSGLLYSPLSEFIELPFLSRAP